ncbi:uncharacterized protein [Amphiura filiformis]|uniref:uncharacterized protein n=1 Tax=Amphiura filiformis TaxID=82378 RepID=UPI003B2103DC
MAKTKSTRVKAPANLPAGEALHINCGSHDVGTSNPTGRVATDGGISRGAQFLKCKKPINIATMNTRTLKNPHKQLELCALAKKYRIEVLAIQYSELQFEDLPEGFQLITASAYRNKIGASIGGVGILLSSSAKIAMLSVRFITSRILQVTLGGNPKTTIITTYSPTNVSGEEDVEEHYKQLNAATKSVPTHNVLIIAGDFNARIGLDDAKFAYHQNTNRNGDFLLEFAQENNLIITNTTFQKKKSKLWTSLVTANIRLSLRANNKSPSKRVKYDWAKLATDPELQDRYTLEIKNRYSVLSDDNCADQTQKYNYLIQANKEAAEKVMPKLPKKQRKALCFDSRVEQARQHLTEVNKRHVKENTKDTHLEFEQSKDELDQAYERANREFIENKLKEYEEANLNHRHKLAWGIINCVSGRKKVRSGRLKDDNKEERLKKWHDHFKNLLGNPPQVTMENEDIPTIFHELPIRTDAFDMEEYQKAKMAIKEGKSYGEDGIPPEVIKRCNIDIIILDFCNAIKYY